MWSKIWKQLQRLVYALPFSMKSGEILTSSNQDLDGHSSSIQQQINNQRLSNDLLRGEVTQQVEELRYRDYRIAQESKNYKYIGNGVAVKIKQTKEFNGRITFTQSNHVICEGVLDTLNETYDTDRYILNTAYGDFPQFNLSKYCLRFKVEITLENTFFTLYFDTHANPNDKTSRQFVNQLEKIKEQRDLNKMLEHPIMATFVTQGLDTEKDYVKYTFKGFNPISLSQVNNEFVLVYKIDEYDREDLIDKFKSDSMKKKYDTNAPKEARAYEIPFEEKSYTCDVCGSKVPENVATVSKDVNNKILCLKCWENALLND